MSFLKKKSSDEPVVQSLDSASSLSDLPPIDGSTLPQTLDSTDLNSNGLGLPPMPGYSQQNNSFNQQPNQPMQFNKSMQSQSNDSKSLSVNVPTLDFSMPLSDDAPVAPSEIVEQPTIQDTKNAVANNYLDVDDLNRLFISDDWKEPDWNSFDPYTEDKIEEPQQDDFKNILPEIEEQQEVEIVDEPVIPPAIDRSNDAPRPVELFIRGRAYARVFTEIDKMNAALIKTDSRVSGYDELMKREEVVVLTAKDQMEYLYKRIMLIDNKVFVQ
jgi:hypothetical protein